MFAYGQDVPVRIFEPGYFAAIGCSPDAALLILDERISFQRYALHCQPVDDRLYVLHFPAEHGSRSRIENWYFGDANHAAAERNNEGELILTHELAAQLVDEEVSRSIVVCGEEKSHELTGTQHVALLRCMCRKELLDQSFRSQTRN